MGKAEESGAFRTGWPEGPQPGASGPRGCCRGVHGGSPCCRFGIRASLGGGGGNSEIGSVRFGRVRVAFGKGGCVDCAAVTVRVCLSQPPPPAFIPARGLQADLSNGCRVGRQPIDGRQERDGRQRETLGC